MIHQCCIHHIYLIYIYVCMYECMHLYVDMETNAQPFYVFAILLPPPSRADGYSNLSIVPGSTPTGQKGATAFLLAIWTPPTPSEQRPYPKASKSNLQLPAGGSCRPPAGQRLPASSPASWQLSALATAAWQLALADCRPPAAACS